MTSFIIKTPDNQTIRFSCYEKAAPVTTKTFLDSLPFSAHFLHARVSGQEIWIDNAPKLDIIQENCSIFTEVGEIVIGPIFPKRNKIAGCMGIFYGQGQLLDCGNIFAKVVEEDLDLMAELGEEIWKKGGQELRFEAVNLILST